MVLCQCRQYRNGRAIRKLIEIIAGLPGNPAKDVKGGFLSVLDLSTFALITEPIGEISQATRFRDFQVANKLVSESSIVRGLNIRSDGSAAVNKLGCSFLYGDLIVSFIGFSHKSLNEAFSLIYTLYINFSRSDVVIESFRTIAYRIIEENCSDNPYVDVVLDQFLSWYDRIELGQGEKISILVVDDNEEWLEVIEDILSPRKIFESSFTDNLKEAKGKTLHKSYDLIICSETLHAPNDGSDWLDTISGNGQRVIALLGNGGFTHNLPQISKSDFGVDHERLIELICSVMYI